MRTKHEESLGTPNDSNGEDFSLGFVPTNQMGARWELFQKCMIEPGVP